MVHSDKPLPTNAMVNEEEIREALLRLIELCAQKVAETIATAPEPFAPPTESNVTNEKGQADPASM